MCTRAYHEAIKADEIRWRSLKYVGVQVIEADEHGPEERTELRDCHCGSTLGKLINKEKAS